MKHSRIFIYFSLGLVMFLSSSAGVSAQKRDHLTPQEIDLVKEAQELDKRIEVFIKAAERRMWVITGNTTATNAKQLKKDSERWGELPSGSRGDLVSDVARILDEAITNIDDVSARDERSPLIPKALRRLAQAVTNIHAQITPLRDQLKSDADLASFELLNEDVESILAAAKKLPPEPDKKAKTKQ